jgi:hypothetical protein
VLIKARNWPASYGCPYTYESGSASLTREPGSDIFHHTRMRGIRTLLVHFSIQNEFIEASCSSGDNTTIPNSGRSFLNDARILSAFFLTKQKSASGIFSLVNCTSKCQASSRFPGSNNQRCEPAPLPAIHGTLLKTLSKKSRLMNVLDMEADMVPSLARDHQHTYEPIASRAPTKALASQAGLGRARLVAPHRQTSLAHWNPSRARLVRVWAP